MAVRDIVETSDVVVAAALYEVVQRKIEAAVYECRRGCGYGAAFQGVGVIVERRASSTFRRRVRAISSQYIALDSSPLACHLNPRGSCIFPKPWGGPEDPETDLGTNLLHIVEAVIQAEDSPPDVVNAVFENLLKARDVSVGGVTKALKRSGFHKRVRPSKDVLMNL